jgi:FkbM family methyltransferase
MSRVQAFDVSTDPVFREFLPWQGNVAAGFDVNFLGQLTDVSFNKGWNDRERMQQRYGWPPYPSTTDEEIFEWRFMLSAVLDAEASFTMVEAGAGYGRWLIGAARACALRRPEIECRLIGVEADPTHHQWMRKHFSDNGVNPDAHRLIFGAVADKDGEDAFVCGTEPSAWYGQHLPYQEHHRTNLEEGYTHLTVPTYSIPTILSDLDRVDLIDFDIQYAEGRVIPASMDVMTRKVKRVFVETHNSDIHEIVYRAFDSHGWKCRDKYGYAHGCPSVEATPYGAIRFQDGVQCWVNPDLTRPDAT